MEGIAEQKRKRSYKKKATKQEVLQEQDPEAEVPKEKPRKNNETLMRCITSRDAIIRLVFDE